MMENFNGIIFRKTIPASKQHTNQSIRIINFDFIFKSTKQIQQGL